MEMQKLLNIQRDLKAPKSQYNSFGKYNYRNCEDILEAVKPLCAREGACLTISDEVVQIGERYYIKATAALYDSKTGEEINHVTAYAREEAEKKGMDGSQVTGAASSYARKYALNGLFDIDDTKDADSEDKGAQSSKSGDNGAKAAPASKQTSGAQKPAQSDEDKLKAAQERKILLKGMERKLGDLPAETLQALAQRAKEKDLRDDMLRVMQDKFANDLKEGDDDDLPF